MIRIATLFLFALQYISLNATTLYVTNTNDSGTGSLRYQIGQAQPQDTVKISRSLIQSGSDTIVLQSELSVTKGIAIIGSYSEDDTLYISGNDSSRIFDINYGFFDQNHTYLDSLYLINGFHSLRGAGIYFYGNQAINPFQLNLSHSFICYSKLEGLGGKSGAGLWTNSPTTMNNCKISHNSILTPISSIGMGFGAGIWANDELIIKNSAINNNEIYLGSMGNGIGIYTQKTTKIINSTISFNKSTNISSFTYGIGIYFEGPSNLTDSIEIQYSTLNDNISVGASYEKGGGLYCNKGNALIERSTIVNNVCVYASHTAQGGGIYAGYSSIEINNSTLVNNSATASSCSGGAGVCLIYSNALINNSIIALNSGCSDLSSIDPVLGDYNVFSDTNTVFSLASSNRYNISKQNLALESLNYNGGTTKTLMPKPFSFVINTGDPADSSLAQNGPIVGRRDRGAAENCNSVFIDSISSCNPITWLDGNQYSSSTDTMTFSHPNSSICDSIWVLRLNIPSINDSIYTDNSYLFSAEKDASYQWIDCNNNFAPIPGATNDSLQITRNGGFAVIVTKEGCSDTSNCIIVSTVDTHELIEPSISVYPNPTSGNYTIESNVSSTLMVEVLSSNGIILKRYEIDGNQKYFDNLDQMPGVYVVKVSNANSVEYFKIIKE